MSRLMDALRTNSWSGSRQVSGEFEYRTLTGYENRGKVKRALDSGWDIVNAVPVSGGTLNMSTFYLRRKTH